jgi:hypothetical protein
MVTHETDAQTFARGSRVHDYWLAHAEGFRVRRGVLRRSRVEAVRLDPWSGRARTLVLRSLLHRRRAVAAEEVVAVDPFERVLVVETERHVTLPHVHVALPDVHLTLPRVPVSAGVRRLAPLVALLGRARPYAHAYARAARLVLHAYAAAASQAFAVWMSELRRQLQLRQASRGLPPGVRRRG